MTTTAIAGSTGAKAGSPSANTSPSTSSGAASAAVSSGQGAGVGVSAKAGASSPNAKGTGSGAKAAKDAKGKALKGRKAIAASIEQIRGDADAAQSAQQAQEEGQRAQGGQQPGEGAEKNAGDAQPEGDKSKDGAEANAEAKADDKGKTEERMIPERALHERLAREKKKLDDLRGQVQQKDVALAKANEAFKLLGEEHERLRGMLERGEKFDKTAEELASMKLADKARQASERVTQSATKQQATDAKAQRASAVESQLSDEIAAAVKKHEGFISENALIAECMLPANLSRPVAEVAAELEAQILERSRAKLVPTNTATPSGHAQRAGGSNAAVDFGHNRKGIKKHIEFLKAQKA